MRVDVEVRVSPVDGVFINGRRIGSVSFSGELSLYNEHKGFEETVRFAARQSLVQWVLNGDDAMPPLEWELRLAGLAPDEIVWEPWERSEVLGKRTIDAILRWMGR